MKNKELKTGLENIREISMTALEKKRVLENILESNGAYTSSVKSPWGFFSFYNFTYRVMPALVVVLLCSGTVFAAQNSLPGNIFYPMKVNVVEPVLGALIPGEEKKAEYQSGIATERLTEAETLAEQGQLDPVKQQEINKVLVHNIASFNKTIDAIDRKNTSKNVDNIITDFHANMNAHAQVLDLINKDDNTPAQNEDLQISKTARDNANITIENFKKQKKDRGNWNDAYSKMLDSESAAKQANILLKSESKFKEKHGNNRENRGGGENNQ